MYIIYQGTGGEICINVEELKRNERNPESGYAAYILEWKTKSLFIERIHFVGAM
jgi:hypothetical protein